MEYNCSQETYKGGRWFICCDNVGVPAISQKIKNVGYAKMKKSIDVLQID